MLGFGITTSWASSIILLQTDRSVTVLHCVRTRGTRVANDMAICERDDPSGIECLIVEALRVAAGPPPRASLGAARRWSCASGAAIGGKTIVDVIVPAGGKAHGTAADLREPRRARRPRQSGRRSRNQ